jgi:5-formyltetrahydrofolate cyclo-ligase
MVRLPGFRRAKRIAAYLASNGELDPLPVMLHATSTRKACYLPRLHPFLKGRMWFLRWRPGDVLQVNRFGIPEPRLQHRDRLPAWMLHWVVVPLVGFDARMNRLGMGQGFYDRRFAFRHHRRVWKRPVLCGFAHHFQQTPGLSSHRWDVPLDLVITDEEVVFPKVD